MAQKNFKRVLWIIVPIILAMIAIVVIAMLPQMNMPRGVTPMSHDVKGLSDYSFFMMVGIGVVVFGIIIISLIFHRKSIGHQSAQFHENTPLEIIWTIIPFLILIALAVPAARILVKETNASDPAMSIEIEGYQWMWQYNYLQTGFSYFSKLSESSNEARMLDSKVSPYSVPHFLRDVDHPLVLPTGEKIRLLITANDVIHSWYVPDFAFKMDAIPGFVNQGWIKIDKPGIYRGGCTELCGRGHAFMPIVVVAEPPAEYHKWLAAMQASKGKYINPQTYQPEDIGSPVVYAPPELSLPAASQGQVSGVAPAAGSAAPAAGTGAATTKAAAAATGA